MRLLVVDDEVDLADAVATGLRREGHAVDVAYDGDAALDLLAVDEYDLVLLDVAMPGDNDGLAVCRAIRDGAAAGPMPRVLMLTARDTVDDRVTGLDAGADDYLVKPFAFRELNARVRTLLRRDAAPTGAVVEVGDLRLDTARQEATRSGVALDLTPKELSVLHWFLTRPGVVVSQEELLTHVWDANTDPFTSTVRVTVGTLRRKLEAARPDAPGPLETLVGQGYRLRDDQ
ncbi:MAG: response regulator transcription factor [Acidimicrobiales bacterium]